MTLIIVKVRHKKIKNITKYAISEICAVKQEATPVKQEAAAELSVENTAR